MITHGLYLVRLSSSAQVENNLLTKARILADERLFKALKRLAAADERQIELLRELLNTIDRARELSSQRHWK